MFPLIKLVTMTRLYNDSGIELASVTQLVASWRFYLFIWYRINYSPRFQFWKIKFIPILTYVAWHVFTNAPVTPIQGKDFLPSLLIRGH